MGGCWKCAFSLLFAVIRNGHTMRHEILLFVFLFFVSSVSAFAPRFKRWAPIQSRPSSFLLRLTTADFKNGMSLEVEGVPMKLLEFLHVKPGKGAAFVRTKVRNLLNGNVLEKTFRAGEAIKTADVLKSDMQFTYADGDDLCLMDTETFEEQRVKKENLDNWEFLNEGATCQVTSFNGNIIEVNIPSQATFKIVEVSTAGSQKTALLENGKSVHVPMFIESGEQVIVSTEGGGKYIGPFGLKSKFVHLFPSSCKPQLEMAVLCMALIGKWNEPLYFYCKEEASDYLHLQMIAHSALDVIEERKKRALSSTSSFDLFFGLLFPTEDYRIYGNYSNTHNKIILVCDSSGPENAGIKETINSLATAFVNAAQNPFQAVGTPLRSKKLDSVVNDIVAKHNLLVSRRR